MDELYIENVLTGIRFSQIQPNTFYIVPQGDYSDLIYMTSDEMVIMVCQDAANNVRLEPVKQSFYKPDTMVYPANVKIHALPQPHA